MAYKKKLLILSVLAGALALSYAAALIFSSDRFSARSASRFWLDPRLVDRVDRVDLESRGEDPFSLVRRDNRWYLDDYPVKSARVEDFLRILSARAAYPQRGTAASSHERLGLTEDQASRIVVRAGAGLPLVDLLVGDRDATGQESYLRENNRNEIYSGEDRFDAYLRGSRASWYNLRLLTGNDGEPLEPSMVQRLTVTVPAPEGESPDAAPLVFTRSDQNWTLDGVPPESLDSTRVDAYIRSVLEAEGDDFIAGAGAGEVFFNEGRISIELGDGTRRSIGLGPALASGPADDAPANRETVRRGAVVSGSPYVYALAEWTVNRIFREASYFKKQE
jgi:hypothetical protein